MGKDRLPGRGDEAGEETADAIGGDSGEIEGQGLEKVFHAPSADDGIVAEDNHRGDDRHYPHPFPTRPRSHLLHSADGIGAASAADYGLGKEDGQGQDEARQDVNYDECSTALFSGDVGEAPDVSKADCGPGHSQNDGQPSAEILSFFHKFVLYRLLRPFRKLRIHSQFLHPYGARCGILPSRRQDQAPGRKRPRLRRRGGPS